MAKSLSRYSLGELKKETDNSLKKDVISTLLEKGTAEDIKSYVFDLLHHGCQSGIEGSLIYYSDTINFFETYQKEINDLLVTNLRDCGFKSPAELFGDKWEDEDPLAKETNNQNLLAWFGFEETVRGIAYELGVEV